MSECPRRCPCPTTRPVLANNHSRFHSAAVFKSHGYCLSQALRFAVEINNSSTLLPNVTLGYDIYDTCSEPANFHATLCALARKGRQDVQVLPSFQHYEPHAVAVIGPDSTRLALTTAAVLSLFLVPEVSAAPAADEEQGVMGSGRVGSALKSLVELKMQSLSVCCPRILPRQSVGWLTIHHSFLVPAACLALDPLPVQLQVFPGQAAHAISSQGCSCLGQHTPFSPGSFCRSAMKPPRRR